MAWVRCILFVIFFNWASATPYETDTQLGKDECFQLCRNFKANAQFDPTLANCKCTSAIDDSSIKEITIQNSNNRKRRDTEPDTPTPAHDNPADAVVGQQLPRPRRIRPIARRPSAPRRAATPARPMSPESARQIMEAIRHRLRIMSDRSGIGSRSSLRTNQADLNTIRNHIRQLSSGVVITDPQQRARANANRASTMNQARQRELHRQQRVRQLRNRSQLRGAGLVGAASSAAPITSPTPPPRDTPPVEAANQKQPIADVGENPPPHFQIITQPPNTVDE